MPSCAVKWCKNNTTSCNKSRGITFHTFPKNLITREKWESVIKETRNDPHWQSSLSSVVCSDHFDESDMYFTKCGLRRITRSGYPKKNLPGSPIIDECNSAALPSTSVVVLDVLDVPLQTNEGLANDSTALTTISSTDVPDIQTYSSEVIGSSCDQLASISSVAVLNSPEMPKSPDDSVVDTPRKKKLKELLVKKDTHIHIKRKQIKTLQQKVRRLRNRNLSLKEIVNRLKSQNFIDTDLYSNLNENIAKVNVFNDLNRKKIKHKIKYTLALKKFCLTLNFYSPKAYTYVRQTFNTCLPHPSTLSRWYGCVEGNPGFTEESFQALKAKSRVMEHRLICSMVFDEMAIRAQKIWDGKKYIGLVDMGTGSDETAPLATQALVFLLVGINQKFKIPLGYFLINSISGEQKANLIKMCLLKCYEANVDVVSITFDGHSTNFTAIELLGCKLSDPTNMKTTFKHPANDSQVACFMDPSHVIKLIRNQFESKTQFVDKSNKVISWKYLIELNNLQSEAGIHLGNKLTKKHINFKNQIMKVKLATQLLSRSVATALKLCREDLKLSYFSDAESTEKFVKVMNDFFDIFNSKSMTQFGFQKPIHSGNEDTIFTFLNQLKSYIINLKVKCVTKRKVTKDGRPIYVITKYYKPVLDAKCKRGFIGIIINIESLQMIYKKVIETEKKLLYIPLYKLSQDHLEIMFSSIRMQGGFNDNPNVRQLKGAYRKLLCHLELKCLSTGNCIPLEDIAILNSTSTTLTTINSTSTSYRHEEQELSAEQELITLGFLREIQEDTANLANSLNVAEFDDFKKYIIGYIAGSTIHYISKILKCQKCLTYLQSYEPHDFHKLILARNKGGLCFPSLDVYNICATCEVVLRKILKEKINLVKESQHKYIVTQILITFTGNNKTFDGLENDHEYAGHGHKVNLIRLVIEKYLNIRLHHISKMNTVTATVDSKRQTFRKLIHHKGF